MARPPKPEAIATPASPVLLAAPWSPVLLAAPQLPVLLAAPWSPVLLAVVMAFTPLPLTAHASEKKSGPQERLSKHPAYWLSFVALLVYVGVELGVSNWVAEYFVAVFAYSPAASARLLLG